MTELVAEPKKELWNKGPNYTADALVFNEDQLLLILRASGDWALPGGFIDSDEDAVTAARREALEETGLTITEHAEPVYQGIVDDPRSSEDRWIETRAFKFEVNTKTQPEGHDDAKDARWFPLDQLPALYASHSDIVSRALLLRATEHGLTEHTKGGHMSYDYRLLHSDSYGPLFSKRHIPERHTDARREANSRLYLRKEAETLASLRDKGFPHIPGLSMLYDDSLLVIEGLPESQGWHWRAPGDEELRERYIRETLASLRQLESQEALQDDALTPSIVSFIEEGWDALDSEQQLASVRDKIQKLQPGLHLTTAAAARRLSSDIESLRDTTLGSDIMIDSALSHHDARQANIAWHPEHGVRLVDWSWAGIGVKGADTTSFLIDIAKSGYDVSPYMNECFNPAHARILIGFWLGHSIWPSRAGNEVVRLHQVASAATAYELLETLG